MKPLLEQKVKNETETVFFINEIYGRQDGQYQKCLSELTNYRKYFPIGEELPLPVTTVGKYVEEQIEIIHPGTNQPTKRGIYYNIKMVFKKQYYKNLQLSELPEKELKPEIFWKVNKDIFSRKFVITNNKEAVAEYIFHSLRSTFTDLQWLNYECAQQEEEFVNKTFHLLSLRNPSAVLSSLDCIGILLEKKKSILVIENLPFLEHRQDLHNEIILFLEKSSDPMTQVILLTGNVKITGEKNNNEEESLVEKSNSFIQSSGEKPGGLLRIPQKYLVVIIILLSVVTGILAFNRQKEIGFADNAMILLRHYSDLIPQDEFEAGVVFSWYNKSGVELHTENNGYNPNFVLNSIPQSASFVVLSAGSYEIYPDTLQVEMLKGDTLRCVAYREIRFGDIVNGEIKAYGAQRWYSIVLPEPGTIQISCIALEKRISPQVAVFTDRIGKHRVISSNNTTGTVETDKISAVLPAGKYYVKVRGYDKSIGLFQLKARKLSDM